MGKIKVRWKDLVSVIKNDSIMEPYFLISDFKDLKFSKKIKSNKKIYELFKQYIKAKPGIDAGKRHDLLCAELDRLELIEGVAAEYTQDIKLPIEENKYNRKIIGKDANICVIDVYDVLNAFKVECPALQHLIKKALCTGLRGHKDKETDLKDILESSKRALQLYKGENKKMTTESKAKIDLTKDRSKQQLKNLLDSVKRNDSGILTKEEQDYYIKEIEFKITGQRFNREDIKKDILAGAADIDDIG